MLIRSTTFSVALLCVTVCLAPVFLRAQEQAEDDTLRRIVFEKAPDYIQTQASNVVMRCTLGTQTPNKAGIWEYVSPAFPDQTHYIIEFSAWKNHPMTPTCTYGVRPYDSSGFLLMVYTQREPGQWVSALRTVARRLKVDTRKEDGVKIPVAEITQAPPMCRMVTNGTDCVSSFTWHGGKFRYYGFFKEGTLHDTAPPVVPVPSQGNEDP